MRRCFIVIGGCILLTLQLLFANASGQQPTPTPAEDAVRIPTEEVHLTIHAEGPFPGVAPKLRAEELTVLEDGVAQPVTSVRTTPAQVLILVDTGAALTFAKTRDVATLATQLVINNLPENASFSVMQYSERIETPVAWTQDRSTAIGSLVSGLPTGRRSLLSDAMRESLKTISTRPAENRHLVLITDGLDGAHALNLENHELLALEEANVVIHVISYTAMEEDGAKDAMRRVRINTRPAKPRVPKEIFDDMVRSLPISDVHKEFLRNQNEARRIVIIDLDSERRKMIRARRAEWKQGETTMTEITHRTGGLIRVPADSTELLNDAVAIGRAVGEYFDVTYSPANQVARDRPREVSVASRAGSIKLLTRKAVRVSEK